MSNKYKDKYTIKTRIELEDGDYLQFREPTIAEIAELSNCPEGSERSKYISSLLDSCLIDHNFMDEGKKLRNNEVTATIRESGTLYLTIQDLWLNKLPLQHRIFGKSDK